MAHLFPEHLEQAQQESTANTVHILFILLHSFYQHVQVSADPQCSLREAVDKEGSKADVDEDGRGWILWQARDRSPWAEY